VPDAQAGAGSAADLDGPLAAIVKTPAAAAAATTSATHTGRNLNCPIQAPPCDMDLRDSHKPGHRAILAQPQSTDGRQRPPDGRDRWLNGRFTS
jgi:hypothetical protein